MVRESVFFSQTYPQKKPERHSVHSRKTRSAMGVCLFEKGLDNLGAL